MSASKAYPAALQKREADWIAARRQNAGCAADAPAVGLALSGGGIRSATFCLGVVQGLAQQGLLKRLDYLSTVSGGGYLGGFLGRLYTRDYVQGPAEVEYLLHPEQAGQSPPPRLAEQRALRPFNTLRNNGNYLAPNGGSDILGALAAAVRNWIALHLVLLSFILLLFVSAQLITQTARLLMAHLPPVLPSLAAQLNAATPCLLLWSPWVDGVTLLVVLLALPLGWAYWLIHRRQEGGWSPLWGLALTAALGLLAWRGNVSTLAPVLLAVATLSLLCVCLSVLGMRRQYPQMAGDAAFIQTAARNLLGRELTTVFWLLTGLLGFVVIDTLGQSIYFAWHDEGQLVAWLAALAATLTPLAIRVGQLPALLSRLGVGKQQGFQVPVAGIAMLAASSLGLLVLSSLDALAHGVMVQFQDLDQPPQWGFALAVLTVLAAYALLFGRTWPFLNRSSQQALYAGRLARAYLGASNERRNQKGEPVSVTDTLPGDDISTRSYGAKLCAHGGPLHLVNVTINQTTGDNQKTVVRDRKGMNLAVGPCGLSAGVRHHAVDDDGALRPVIFNGGDYNMFAREDETLPSPQPEALGQPLAGIEALPLGQWIAISGAAFTTGLGARSTAALAWLLGFANVRLGYWWDAGQRLPMRKTLQGFWRWLFPLQNYLLDEFTATFRGPAARRWYLSDGGHFENMGAYELIRRRLPIMVVVDGEADPDYGYEGFANLVRKARLDFAAEIEVLHDEALGDTLHPELLPLFGPLDQLRPVADEQGNRFSPKRAALARVRYHDGGAESLLLYLKPTLAANDPSDVREYRKAHPDFPQQTTLDQFFDEAQWESYRRLGLAIAEAVFARPGTPEQAGFVPGLLRR